MQKLYAQKSMFTFMHVSACFFLALGVVGGLVADSGFWAICFISLFLFALSLLMLTNRIYFDDTHVRFAFLYKKGTYAYEDIAEIFIEDTFITGCYVIVNFEKAIGENCASYRAYCMKLKALQIHNTSYWAGMKRKDLDRLLRHYHGKVTEVTNSYV